MISAVVLAALLVAREAVRLSGTERTAVVDRLAGPVAVAAVVALTWQIIDFVSRHA